MPTKEEIATEVTRLAAVRDATRTALEDIEQKQEAADSFELVATAIETAKAFDVKAPGSPEVVTVRSAARVAAVVSALRSRASDIRDSVTIAAP